MPEADLSYAIGLPPDKAITYFESKGYAIGFRWQDIAAQTHARAFTVAGVMKVDILQDIRQALADALNNGTTFADFKKQLSPTLERKGWLGRGMIVNNDTGEIEGKRLTPRRLDTIFRTNLQSSYMAGRYATQIDQADQYPYWEYVAVLDNRTRPAHRALSGSVYRYDDPFWGTFYPPNGWNCRCRVRTRSQGYIDQNDIGVRSSAGQMKTIEQPVGKDGATQPAKAYTDPLTGKTIAPDPGFGGNPGAQWMQPFTPPPIDTLPTSFPPGSPRPTLPDAPLTIPESPKQTLTTEQAAQVFVSAFASTLDASGLFNDTLGYLLPINTSLFKNSAGNWASLPDDAAHYAAVLAQAIQDPDEIWLGWAQSNGQWTLRRRYLRTVTDSSGRWGIAIFDTGQDGWGGSVTFASENATDEERLTLIDQQRGTFLAYRRPPNGTAS